MPCKNCGEKVSSRHSNEQTNIMVNNYSELFREANEFSFDTLLRMRKDIREKEETKYKEMLNYMSDDLKALKILTFAKIFNALFE